MSGSYALAFLVVAAAMFGGFWALIRAGERPGWFQNVLERANDKMDEWH